MLKPAQSLMQALARLGRQHTTALTDEQRRLELLFQRVDLPAQRRLRDPQRLRGAADVAVIDYRKEVLNLANIERHHGLSINCEAILFSYRINRVNAIAAYLAWRYRR